MTNTYGRRLIKANIGICCESLNVYEKAGVLDVECTLWYEKYCLQRITNQKMKFCWFCSQNYINFKSHYACDIFFRLYHFFKINSLNSFYKLRNFIFFLK